jgi:hypothetical protein
MNSIGAVLFSFHSNGKPRQDRAGRFRFCHAELKGALPLRIFAGMALAGHVCAFANILSFLRQGTITKPTTNGFDSQIGSCCAA